MEPRFVMRFSLSLFCWSRRIAVASTTSSSCTTIASSSIIATIATSLILICIIPSWRRFDRCRARWLLLLLLLSHFINWLCFKVTWRHLIIIKRTNISIFQLLTQLFHQFNTIYLIINLRLKLLPSCKSILIINVFLYLKLYSFCYYVKPHERLFIFT